MISRQSGPASGSDDPANGAHHKGPEDTMAALEGMCGALSARRITDEQRSNLVEAHKACDEVAKNDSTDSYYYANKRFHQAIYDACNNAYLAEQARQLQTRLQPYRRLQLRARHRVSNSLNEHQKIVEAILDGDSAKAEQHLRKHILIQGERLTDFIASWDKDKVA